MGYRVTKTLTTTNGNTYADTAAWIADHGPCGTNNDTYIQDHSFTLINETSVRRVTVYADEAAYLAHKADKSGPAVEFSTSDITTETF